MSDHVELKFHIDAFSPETIPMKTLVEFLGDLAQILGEHHSVHFVRLEGGSTTPVVRINREAVPAVFRRANAVRMNEGPEDAIKAKRRVERRLIENNAVGADLLDDAGAKILHFRGRGSPQEVYGPVRQLGELIGAVIMIGGMNDPVPVHLRDGDRTYICEAKIEVAKRLRDCLFESAIRASGYGLYLRNDQGDWEMQKFRIIEFDLLDSATFASILGEMRQVRSPWLEGPDPLSAFTEDD
jgi:hypothetical protein